LVFLIPYLLKSVIKESKPVIFLLLLQIITLLSWNLYIRHELFNFSLLQRYF
jgi:hypothetical protein